MQKIIYDKFEQVRLDSFLAATFKDYSRTYFHELIQMEPPKVLVNSKQAAPSYKLKHGDIIEVELINQVLSNSIAPENIDIDIVYEDDDIIVLNKPAGIVVHPSYAHESSTLLNALLGYANGKWQPFMVHRLDMDTTGLIIFAKTQKAKVSLSKQFQKRAVKKTYYTAVLGLIEEDKGRIEAPLGRDPQNRKIMTVNPLAKKMAITEFTVLARLPSFTLVKVNIITGRTHQIRSHFKYINHPVLGDKQYGGADEAGGRKFTRQVLHCASLKFTHPATSKPITLNAPLPDDIKEIFDCIKIK